MFPALYYNNNNNNMYHNIICTIIEGMKHNLGILVSLGYIVESLAGETQ